MNRKAHPPRMPSEMAGASLSIKKPSFRKLDRGLGRLEIGYLACCI